MAGIESPGVTAAPAIAVDLVNEAAKSYNFAKNEAFNPIRKEKKHFRDMTDEERSQAIAEDPNYGKIVCRCELISEGEILDALRKNPVALDLDGVKRRTRSGMGRCQGGFCGPYIMELISKERQIPMTAVTKSGNGSHMLVERIGNCHANV